MSTTSLRDTLQGIYDKHGRLTPVLVVDLARDETHPLHHRFEWDDTKAAESWRQEQAGALIRSVRVVYKRDENGTSDLRAFVALRDEGTPRSNYVPTGEALADPIARELILRQMKREWLTFKERYEHMAEFAALIASGSGFEVAS